MERLRELLRAELYAELLEEAARSANPPSLLFPPSDREEEVREAERCRLRACAAFHTGRFGECRRLLDACQTPVSRLNRASAALQEARSAGTQGTWVFHSDRDA